MKKNKTICMGIMVVLFHMGCESQNSPLTELFVESVKEPIINLNGTWKINTAPEKEFWSKNEIGSNWKDIQVPGEVMMQGFSIKNDEPFVYKKEIDIPLDYQGKNIHLQFEGVYSYARVWINGNYVRDHHGGFTQWGCNITPHVKAGEKAVITVEVTDRTDEISYASGYARHQIGGILRDVSLLAQPKNYPSEIVVETKLDKYYKDAQLIVSGKLFSKGKKSKVNVQLLDAEKNEVKLANNDLQIRAEDTFKLTNRVSNPKKWDAEHPYLYSLRVSYYENDKLLWSKSQKIGFRDVKVAGNSLLVNGKPVKLRGANRHDIHPTLGRVSTPDYELKDVLLIKESNMNYIRTSHYPPTSNFLKLCDEYGVYVEDETAICFVRGNRIKAYKMASKSESDPIYRDRYLSQFKEMINNHRNHPSVVIWSIGNESNYGSNFQESYDWAKKTDNTRPVMFSYPGTVPDSIAPPYNILSMHYQDINGDLEQFGTVVKGYGNEKMPVVFDEWAHVACYNNESIIEDPNIRDFWGESLDRQWQGVFNADGGLGGAIWGMIDETFMLPKDLEGFNDWWGLLDDRSIRPYKGTTVGYGEWGIVDTWRRKKPEFWNTKKAYSPIKILSTTVKNYQQGNEIMLPIYNRFDHTDLNEVVVKYSYKGKTEILKKFSLKPHEKGVMSLPILEWDNTENIAINFYAANDKLIDSYNIKQQGNPINSKLKNDAISGKISIEDKKNILIVHTNRTDLVFDKNTGLLKELVKEGKKYYVSGPYMTYRTQGKKLSHSTFEINDYGQDWKLENFNFNFNEDITIVSISGSYKELKASFELKISANGKLNTNYTFENLPKEYVKELGVKYSFDAVFDSLYWDRDSYWSSYPENHISGISGKVPLYSKVPNHYRQTPQKPWEQDSKSFYYEGTDSEQNNDLTYVAKATKEHVHEYSLLMNDEKWITIQGKGNTSCRLTKKDALLELYLNSKVDYFNLNWGNYERNILLNGSFTGEVELFLNPGLEN